MKIRTIIKVEKLKEEDINEFIGKSIEQLNKAEEDSIMDFQVWYKQYIDNREVI